MAETQLQLSDSRFTQDLEKRRTAEDNDGPNTPATAGSSEPVSEDEPSSPPIFHLPTDPDVKLLRLPSHRRWRAYLFQSVQQDIFLEAELLILTLATGILDAMTFVWYRTFVSKQTGNAVLIALASLESKAVVQTEPHVATSLCVSIAGAAIFGHVGHLIGQHRRVWLIVSNVLQTALVFGATALRFWGSDRSNGPESVGVVALLALSCGGQIALALCVKMPELNTTMITGALVMLAVDRNIFKRKNLARNRRVLSFLIIVAGGFIGAAVDRYFSPTFSLLLVAILKTIVTVMFLFNRGTKKRRINLEGATESARSSVTFLKAIWGD